MTTIKQFRWFWAWDDEVEEAWLRDMAQKGWHFKSVALPGNYTFEQGEPKNYIFRLDYLTDRKDMVNYIQLFQDAGWDYMGEMNNWQYFRKESVNGEVPEIYSDNESKAKKYQRILTILVVFLPIFIININNLNRLEGPFYEVLTFIFFLLIILYGYVIIRLGGRLNELKKKV